MRKLTRMGLAAAKVSPRTPGIRPQLRTRRASAPTYSADTWPSEAAMDRRRAAREPVGGASAELHSGLRGRGPSRQRGPLGRPRRHAAVDALLDQLGGGIVGSGAVPERGVDAVGGDEARERRSRPQAWRRRWRAPPPGGRARRRGSRRAGQARSRGRALARERAPAPASRRYGARRRLRAARGAPPPGGVGAGRRTRPRAR